jgi:hypothetical protein
VTVRRRTLIEAGICAFVLAVLGAPGCSGRPPAPPGAVWVDGEVRHVGAALPFGVVQFFATDSVASGSVRIKAGRFGLYLKPGSYQVAIIAEEMPGHEDEKGGYVPAKSLIPERFGDIKTSKLEAEVRQSMGRLRFDLDR